MTVDIRYYCANCGTHLYTLHDKGPRIIPATQSISADKFQTCTRCGARLMGTPVKIYYTPKNGAPPPENHAHLSGFSIQDSTHLTTIESTAYYEGSPARRFRDSVKGVIHHGGRVTYMRHDMGVLSLYAGRREKIDSQKSRLIRHLVLLNQVCQATGLPTAICETAAMFLHSYNRYLYTVMRMRPDQLNLAIALYIAVLAHGYPWTMRDIVDAITEYTPEDWHSPAYGRIDKIGMEAFKIHKRLSEYDQLIHKLSSFIAINRWRRLAGLVSRLTTALDLPHEVYTNAVELCKYSDIKAEDVAAAICVYIIANVMGYRVPSTAVGKVYGIRPPRVRKHVKNVFGRVAVNVYIV